MVPGECRENWFRFLPLEQPNGSPKLHLSRVELVGWNCWRCWAGRQETFNWFPITHSLEIYAPKRVRAGKGNAYPQLCYTQSFLALAVWKIRKGCTNKTGPGKFAYMFRNRSPSFLGIKTNPFNTYTGRWLSQLSKHVRSIDHSY